MRPSNAFEVAHIGRVHVLLQLENDRDVLPDDIELLIPFQRGGADTPAPPPAYELQHHAA